MWGNVTLLWATTSHLCRKLKDMNCTLWVLSLHRPPNRHQPQANRGWYCEPTTAASGKGACFLRQQERAFDSGSDKHWHPSVPASVSSSSCPTDACPIKFLNLPLLACHSLILPLHTPCTCPFFPSLWSSKLPMLRSWKHLLYLLLRPTSTPAASTMHLSSVGLDDLYFQSGPMQP